MSQPERTVPERTVHVHAGGVTLEGNLDVPQGAKAVILFAHGSGSSRFSPRNRFVAEQFRNGGLGTLLIDLLTPDEERVDVLTREHRFDILLLSDRLSGTIDWLGQQAGTRHLPVGLFGASTGGGAALHAASRKAQRVFAVVSRGGRPDLAREALPDVKAPTLLIVGERDPEVIRLNQLAFEVLRADKHLSIIPGATHLFEEPGKLEEVAQRAREWFTQHLASHPRLETDRE